MEIESLAYSTCREVLDCDDAQVQRPVRMIKAMYFNPCRRLLDGIVVLGKYARLYDSA